MSGRTTGSSARRLIIAMPGNEVLASELARQGGHELGGLNTRRFPDGETYVRIEGDVQGRIVHVICTLAHPDDRFLPLAFVADAVRELGAAEVHLVAPYLGYMRQDKRFRPGEAVTSRTFSRLVSSLFDSLVTVDAHLHRYDALDKIYSIPAQNLQAAPAMALWIAEHVESPLLIGPDEESAQWVEGIARQSGAPFIVLRKTRFGDRTVKVEVPDLTPWTGLTPVLVDDIASSGRTLIEAAQQTMAQGLGRPVCAVVHGLFAANAYVDLRAVARNVVSTNSVPHASNAVSLTPMLLAAMEGRVELSGAQGVAMSSAR